jgi:3-deoxy-D-manno-octulosonic-acid transferase
MILIYNFLLYLFTPLLKIYFNKRYIRGKETTISLQQKFANYKVTFPILKKPARNLWFHAVSVGETLSIIPLINKLAVTNNFNIILTTTTLTSQKISYKRLHKNIIHQFAPLDKVSYINNFLNYFKPDLAIWVESELWPNMILQTHKRKIPMILLNARISDKPYIKNMLYKLFAGPLLNKFSLILPQEKQDLSRVKGLIKNHHKIKYIGNLKLNCPTLPCDRNQLMFLQKQTSKRIVFLAASTHLGEEKIIADIHQKLIKNHPNLLTIIVPRHPNRSQEIIDELENNYQLSLAIRSNKDDITYHTNIYLADTIGELGLFYRLANIACIGGSLVDIGGHNPIEAMQLECPVISGPYIKNFKDLYTNLAQNKATIILKETDNISDIINYLISDNKLLKKQINSANQYLASKNNILSDTKKIIMNHIKP